MTEISKKVLNFHYRSMDNQPTWNSRRTVEMLASLARLVKISNCKIKKSEVAGFWDEVLE